MCGFRRIVQKLQHHQYLDSEAVGIGDNALMCFQSVGIDLGHHQGAAPSVR